jgi:NAD-dependent dihydropyrimidine dehydrogenase PreA subunit
MAPINVHGKKMVLPIARACFDSELINIPKWKTHEYMLMTGCVKNLYGVLGGDAKKKFHRHAKDKESFASLLLDIYYLSQCRFNIVDAVYGLEGYGPGVKGRPRKIGFLAMGRNGIAVDFVMSKLVGIQPQAVLTNRFSGLSMDDIRIFGENLDDCIIDDYALPDINPRMDKVLELALALKSYRIQLKEDRCVACGECIKNCPMDALRYTGSRVVIDTSLCISCFVCAESCLREAVIIDEVKALDRFVGRDRV